VSDPSSLRFDIPLDPRSELAVTKTVDRQYADVGDFVNYTITVQNSGDSSVPVTVSDTLPIGFRYVEGTSRRDDVLIADPAVSANATHLSFPMGILGPNESVEIDYALEIGPGGFVGDAINRAIVLDGAGNALSNIARAKVNLREDLLRSTSTIVGRITENSCDASEEWAREIQRGDGVQGVRIYTETGAYAVSDPDGLFHFEGVTEGTHVIQIDEETLPAGFEAMHCEENTRYAGSNISKFVDVQGGGVWRANFYLRRTGEEFTQSVDEQQLVDQTEYKNYDQAWLATQTSEPEWVYPIGTPSIPSANLGIKHGAGEKVSLVLNGSPVSALNFEARDSDPSRKIFISRWRGVDLLEGANRFDVTVTNEAGQIVKRFSHDLHFVKDVERAYGVPDKSVLIADGRTTPEVAVRLEDAAGNPVHAGRIVEIDVVDPYRLETDMRLENSEELLAPLSARANVNVGVDGIARVKLEPTLQTGKVTVNVKLDNGRIVPIYMYLEPEKRDWIIVGLAEGSAGYETVKDKSISLTDTESDTVTDGRVAFFAKGLIKGNWLLTLAVDTDKRRTGRDGDFLEEIDPNAYYTLYGDRSYQEYEAQSRYPVYVKLEKKSAYALFGDFDTNITEGRLSSYNRRLSGLKAEYVGENFQVLGFAAETNQGFAKDEIAADGTSGTYQLSNRNILAQSESIVVETRDRHRPDIILDRRQMVRYLDYTLDYLTGEMIFRLPIDATDSEFNPNVIVADYETSEDAERNLTYGGRAQAQLMNGRVQVGSSFVSENGSALTTGSKQVMVGVDAVAQVTDNTELRVEYAVTEDKSTAGSSPAEAMLAEVIHTSGDVSAQAYFRQEDGGFGLGQTGSNTNDIRRYGVIGNVKINEFENEETGQRGRQTIEATAYREDNLGTGESRDTGEIMLRHQGDRLTVGAGVRASRDELVSQPNRESVIAIAQASLSVPKHGATFQLSHEQPLQGKDEVSAYPQRTTLGVDKTIGDKAVVTVRHEILKGATTNSDNTVFGLSVTPWTGSSVTASSDLVTGDSGRRLGATIGLDQQIKLTDKWSASAGLRNRRILDDQGDFVEVTPDAAISPFETNDDFTSAYVGLGYNTDATAITTRIEGRDASSGKTLIASGSVARELTEQLSLAGAVRGTIREDVGPSSQNVATSQVDAHLGDRAARRPLSLTVLIMASRKTSWARAGQS
jgi:uncharacterized repeat protein (TIGR01451 family)